MLQRTETPRSAIEATYKAREVEGVLDLYFYRPTGFWLAELFARFKMTPAAVSLLAGIFGVVAGHLYYYRDLSINVAGMALHICANALDNADGQLARLTRQESREGRIIDSVADHLGFVSVYVHLTLRYLFEGSSPAICLLALAAGISHALQGAAADYYRSTYLYFATTGNRTGLDSSSELRSDYRKLTWRHTPWQKLLLALYLNFTRQQEMLAPRLKALRNVVGQLFHSEIPDRLSARYRNLASPMLKWWRLLMTNIRMLMLFGFLFIGQPVYYFWFELIPLNLFFFYLLFRQETMAESLLEIAKRSQNSASPSFCVSKIEISEVSSRRERNAFIKFPWRVYANDPAWVPPLIIERRAFIDRSQHPFYHHGDAALFLAHKNGEIVGRIMASDDPNYNALHQTNVGCFGLFECINDRDIAAALFERAASWLREKGRTEIMGPIDYSTNYTCGLLVRGFEHPPTLLTTHNPPYYERLIDDCGFSKVIDFFAWWFSDPSAATARLRKLAARLELRTRFTIRRANLRNLEAEAANFLRIYDEAWKDNWGFVPFTEAEFDYMAAEMKPLLRDDFTAVAETDGEAIGFALCLPDINVALKKIGGRLTTFGIPIGLARLLYYKSRIRKARYIAMGVRPQFRRLGVAEMMVLRIMEAGMVKCGFQGELSMTLENNVMINRFIESIGARRYKTYRIYRKQLPC